MSQTGRVLNTWVVEGSNNGSDWLELDSRAAVAWTSNNQVQYFTVRSNQGSYTYIRLRVLRRGTGTGVTTGGIIQFGGFGMYSDAVVDGVDATTNYEGLQTTVGAGPAQLWGNTSSRANLGWTGSRALRIAGKKLTASASSYTTIYDGLEISINPDTKLSYMVLPYIDADVQSNEYDEEYTSNYAAIDLKFDDGTYLRNYGVLDQYGFKVSPLEQGKAGIIEQNNWLKVTSAIGAVPALAGKTITSILVGYEKPNGTPGKDVAVYFDDVKIYREQDPVISDLADYVNILRGTQNGAYTEDHNKYAHGLNNPIVATPYPFNFWSPATTMSAQTVYQYTGSEANFKHIHLNHVASNWIGESGNFDFSADSSTVWSNATNLNTDLRARGSNFKHENEVAHAHYYGVTFNEDDAKAPGVKIEVTPTEHGAVLRFTFPEGAARRNVILDSAKARNTSTSGITYNNDGTFAAFTSRANNGQKRMYVYGQFSVTPSAFRATTGSNIPLSMFEFPAAASGPTVVELKVASSFISAAQAIKNLNLEISAADNFESVKARALAEWNKMLSTVKIDDPNATYDQLSSLYSNMYRAFVYPLLDSENTGTSDAPVWQYASPYSGNATTITLKDGRLFYNNGFWDTYRTAWPLYALLIPNKDSDLVNGLVQHYLDNGWVPRWIAPAGTNSMVGTNSDSIFGDAISQGIEFNYKDAYASSLKNATVYSANNSANFYSGRAGMATWPFLGYSPTSSLTDENLSWSLESCPADFGIAQMAKALRDKETPGTEAYRKLNDEYIYFINRAQNFVNLFNPALGGWFRGKTVDGAWLWPDSQFNPVAFGYGYCEDNAWNYAFHAPQDGRGLANLYGGQDKLGDKLDALLSASPQINFGNWSGWHKEKVESRGSKLGQLHMSNEPAFHIPYMYLYSDRPWRTADVVRDILDRHFAGSDIGQGYIGDDDNGAMSSWYVISSLGLYPLTGGNGQFVFGTPLFSKSVITRDNGDTITITAPGVSRTNKYIQSVKVNGVEYSKTYVNPSDILGIPGGAAIEFTMGPTPSATYGIGFDAQPPSLAQDDEAPVPLHDLTTAISPSTTTLPSGFSDGAYTNATSPASLFNNTSADYASFAAGSKFVYYYFAKGAVIDMYTLTSSTSATAPTEWVLSGSLDGSIWKELDVRKNQVFEWERYTRPFAIESPGRYKYYKIEFTNDTEQIRVAQLELLGGKYALISKEVLDEMIQQARAIDGKLYAEETYLPLADAIAFAEDVYDDIDASGSEIADAIERIESALEGLIRIKFAGEYFDGVECDIATAGVKKETTANATGVLTGDITNLGGLTPGSHVGFRYVNFGDGRYWWTRAKIIYAGKQADLVNSRVIVHLDALDGPVIADFGLEATGAEWNVYEAASGALSINDITGFHTVYFEFRGSGTSVANINSFVFEYTMLPGLGEVRSAFTDDTLTTSFKYLNESDETRDLTLYTAIYTDTGKMKYYASSELVGIGASKIVDFEIKQNIPGIKDECLGNGYSIGVFLWDSHTFIPVIEAYKENAPIIIARQELAEAKAAIEAGVYKIPAGITAQADKTAWVQNQVDSLIPEGNMTVATVSFDGEYIVELINGSVTDVAVIFATQPSFVTFSAPDADVSYLETFETDAFGTVALPASPVRSGYRFLGWYYGRDDGDWRFTPDTVIVGSAIARAKWAIDPSAAHSTIVFDTPTYTVDMTMMAYSSSGENGAQAVQFRDDTVGRIDNATNRYMYIQLPTTHALRNVTDIAFDITYYDIGTTQFMFETANTTLTGTERNYGNRFWIQRSNSGELVTHTIYATNVGMQRGQNGSCDFRIQGQAQYVYIKSIVVRAGVQTPFEDIEPPAFAPQTTVNNLIGKSLAGYQLWFTASDTNSGWVHWSRGQRPITTAQITFENYPDVREYAAAALSNTTLTLANGSPGQLFTSKRKDVVDLHFDWIAQYGLDGVAVQRFSGEVVTSPSPTRNHINLVQDAAERTGKTFYVMYDFSNCNNNTVVNNIKRDWVYSIEQKGIASSPSYAHADGKPVVCLWGLSGVASASDGNVYVSQANALNLINWFHDRGYYVIGGTPDNDWTERTNNSNDPNTYRLVYQALDMISPWTPGRYGRVLSDIVPWLDAHVNRELAYCAQYGIEYQPVMYAGFNWSSFQPYPPNEIPREAGEMLWTQAKYLKNKGIKTAYYAMFDEYDEGTALMKTAEDSSMLPLGTTPYWQTLAADGRWLSSDFYLRLGGAVINLLGSSESSVDMSAPVPIPHSLGPVYWRNGFESRYQVANTRFAGGYVQVDVCLYKPAVVRSVGVTGGTNEIVMENGHAGTAFSFSFKGTGASATSERHYKIAETAILAPSNLQLSYWINAANDLGRSVYVNLQFSDGSLLSEGAGFVQKKAASTGSWEQITVDLDAEYAGKTITAVVVSYENGAAGDFAASIDDIVIQVKP
ncbi:MAG: GH92 family glycosyl hydrolase [Oscillospiraceae bacterium]|nr:GH92 family glycosyl hydrolase [Oscillospiraceae bacterium]